MAPAWRVGSAMIEDSVSASLANPVSSSGRPKSYEDAPAGAVTENRTDASPAAATPIGPPPGAGKVPPSRLPIHNTRYEVSAEGMTTAYAGETRSPPIAQPPRSA